MKIYGVELSEVEAQDVCKLFKSKKDAEYFAKIAKQILNLHNAFMKCWRNAGDDSELQIQLSAGIGSDINDIADIWGISTFYETVEIREYEVQ